MLDDEAAKAKIRELVNEYYEYKTKNYSEGAIETKLILPLFEALGWDIQHDTIPKESIQRKEGRGIPDFTLQVNGVTVFYLEAKRLSTKSTEKLSEDAAKQAISYSLSRRVPFAVLTNFEELKIFCAEENEAFRKPFKHFKCEEFIDRFNELKLLSRPSFEENKLLELASREGRLKARRKIDKVLLDDLMLIRKKIVKNIEEKYPNKYSIQERDDIIQRILDRLIFIRKCEDTQNSIDGINLKEMLGFSDQRIYSKLKEAFTEYNDIFDSGLFKPNYDNDCDNLALDGQVIKELITLLYESKDKQYIYNFSWIDADILGQVYEQYLGQILAETKTGRTKLKEGKPHKKEQGIYYTPTVVVDYIAKNTIENILKTRKAEEIKDIKILDPACGSGSFLIKAFDKIKRTYAGKGGEYQRLNLDSAILTENLFGVDLDEKAVEVAALNLLLKASETKNKLPELKNNLKCGNSIIDDEKVAGSKAFNWENKFPEIMVKKFDVIMGNPPYDVIYSGEKQNEFDFYKQKYGQVSAEYNPNLFAIFIDKSIDLLKDGGTLGLIVPDTLLTNKYFGNLRKKILNQCSILQIIDLSSGVFPDAVVDTIIIILEKKRRKNNVVTVGDSLNVADLKEIKQSEWETAQNFEFHIRFKEDLSKLKTTINENCVSLGEISNIKRGMVTKDNSKWVFDSPTIPELEKEKIKPLLIGKDATRYKLNYSGHYIFFDKKAKGGGCWDKDVYDAKEKILIALITGGMKYRINATLDRSGYYVLQNYNNLIMTDSNFDARYILGLINSKLLNWYYSSFFNDKNIKRVQLMQLPIRNITREQQTRVIELVDLILEGQNRLNKIGDKNTAESARINDEITKADSAIDELVYQLYGLSDAEKQVIARSFEKTA